MNEAPEFIKKYVECMKRNIEIATNVYTEMGYEIALDVLKTSLKNAGYNTNFMEENEND